MCLHLYSTFFFSELHEEQFGVSGMSVFSRSHRSVSPGTLAARAERLFLLKSLVTGSVGTAHPSECFFSSLKGDFFTYKVLQEPF